MARIDQLSYYPALTERIRALAGQGLDSTAIAGQDTLPPYRWIITADPAEVQRLRALHQLPALPQPAPLDDDGTPIDRHPQDKEPGNHEGRDPYAARHLSRQMRSQPLRRIRQLRRQVDVEVSVWLMSQSTSSAGTLRP